MLNSYSSLFLNYVIKEALPTTLVDSALDCDRFGMAFWSQLKQAQSKMGAGPAVLSQKLLFRLSLPSLSALPYKLNRVCYKSLFFCIGEHTYFPVLNADLFSVL